MGAIREKGSQKYRSYALITPIIIIYKLSHGLSLMF